MGAIAIQPISQSTIGGGVQRVTDVTLPPGIQPVGDYWLGVKINKANGGIVKLMLGATNILSLGRNAAVEHALNQAYPIPDPTPTAEWWGFEVPANQLPPLYPKFRVEFSLTTKLSLAQNVPWNIVKKPSLGGGGFGSGVPEAQGASHIA